MADFGLEPHYVKQFNTNIQMLLQQKDSRFASAVSSGSHVGKQASPVDQVGAVTANRITGRLQPMTKTEAPLKRRWVSPNPYDVTQYADRLDMLKVLNDPKSIYTQSAISALKRAMDDEIIAAFFATAKVGEEGTTDQAWTPSTSSNQVEVTVGNGGSGNVGLNVEKLIRVRRFFLQKEVDLDQDPIFMAINARQQEDLLNDIQVVSKDYNPRAVLVDGKLPSYLGINFIHSERLGTSGGYRACPAWVKSGMYLGIWSDIETDVTQRKDMRAMPWQIYTMNMFGATRTDEDKVCQVLCNEA